jgi:hypothetical protein
MVKLLRRPILWFMQSRLYSWLLLHVIPYVRFSMYYTKLRGKHYARGYWHLSRGHIILTKDNKKLTSLLIGGEFTHAALCVGKGPSYPFEIAEMTHTNFTRSWFFDICKEADRVVILRCKDWDPEYTDLVVSECLTMEDAKYDTAFELGVKALYCSELVYQADFKRKLKVNLEDLAGLGRQYISPNGLYHAENVEVVWDSEAM